MSSQSLEGKPLISTIARELEQRKRFSKLEKSLVYRETPSFKIWFSDEGLKDPDGAPLLLFHGSGLKFSTHDISLFKDTKGTAWQVDGGYFGSGNYFTKDRSIAELYAQSSSKKHQSPIGYITHSYCNSSKFISFEHPIHQMVDEEGNIDVSKIPLELRGLISNKLKARKTEEPELDFFSTEPDPKAASEQLLTSWITETAIQLGYDGAYGINNISNALDYVVYNPETLMTVNREIIKVI